MSHLFLKEMHGFARCAYSITDNFKIFLHWLFDPLNIFKTKFSYETQRFSLEVFYYCIKKRT